MSTFGSALGYGEEESPLPASHFRILEALVTLAAGRRPWAKPSLVTSCQALTAFLRGIQVTIMGTYNNK